MSKIRTLEDFLIEELKVLYSVQKQLTRALPKILKAATSKALEFIFKNHIQETAIHILRLEDISKILLNLYQEKNA